MNSTMQRAPASQRAYLGAVRPPRPLFKCSAAVEGPSPGAASPKATKQPAPSAWQAKRRLLKAVEGTERGGEASRVTRGEVEEAQVAVEAFAAPELDYELLEGKWRLDYTTASDVLPLVRPPHSLGPLAPLSIGRIYQQFSSLGEGRAENIIEATLRLPALEGTGVTLTVEATYEPRTARSIALTFRGARAGDLQLSPELQNTLASPLLPRGWWNLQALMWLRELSLSAPLLPRPRLLSSSRPTPVGFNYLLTYLDEDMLIGRAQGNGGTFIFSREAAHQQEQQGGEWGAAAAGAEQEEEADLIL